MKKITLASLKLFIKNNRENLFINVHSSFDGMIDGVRSLCDGFNPAINDKTVSRDSSYYEATLGIEGVWLVRGSRDYFTSYNGNGFTGIQVNNSCGKFTVAIKN